MALLCLDPFVERSSQVLFRAVDRRKLAFELFRQALAQAVAGDADGLGHVAQGVLGDEAFAAAADDQSDARLVVRVAEEVVDGGEVEVELAGVFGFEIRVLSSITT